MTIKEIKDLALCCARNEAPANYSIDSCKRAFMDGIKGLASNYNQFMKNRYDIYEILIETIDKITPNKVLAGIGAMAEVKQVGQGQKALFKTRVGKNRAKQFLTQVGLSGVYETFRLDTTTFEVGVHAIGGAVTIDYERMLDGEEELSEVMAVITEALTDSVFVEVQRALKAALNAQGRPEANKHSSNGFDADAMVKLCNVVKAYAPSAIIMAPPEFIGAMGADAIVPVGANYQGVYHPQDIDAIHNTGRINIFRGNQIVEIPQSFIDENNEKTWIDPQLAYILPSGGEKVVKVAFEGQTQTRDWQNTDGSMEVHIYKKMGTAILAHHNWCIYQNTGITQTYENPYNV